MAKFSVGQRVRVYGRPSPGAGVGAWSGTVVEQDKGPHEGKTISVQADYMGRVFDVHPKQCRRLKSRKPKEVKPKKLPVIYVRDYPEEKDSFKNGDVIQVDICKEYARRGSHWRRFQLLQDDLHEGEIVVSKADLEKAWDAILSDKAIMPAQARISPKFNDFCKALGFESEGK